MLPQRKAYPGRGDNILLRDVVSFRCLSGNALRPSVRVDGGRVEGVDAVVVPVNEGSECK